MKRCFILIAIPANPSNVRLLITLLRTLLAHRSKTVQADEHSLVAIFCTSVVRGTADVHFGKFSEPQVAPLDRYQPPNQFRRRIAATDFSPTHSPACRRSHSDGVMPVSRMKARENAGWLP